MNTPLKKYRPYFTLLELTTLRDLVESSGTYPLMAHYLRSYVTDIELKARKENYSSTPTAPAQSILDRLGYVPAQETSQDQILWTQYKAGSSLSRDDLITALDYGQSRKLLDDSEESKLSELIMARTFGA